MQDGQLLSWGRPTYGGLGRASEDVASDTARPQPQRVDRLDDVHVSAAAGGVFGVNDRLLPCCDAMVLPLVADPCLDMHR